MENEHEDLRIVRTKRHLRDALLKLLEEKSLEEISVNDICDAAMVHRTTFYKHFEDKYHLFRETLYEMETAVLPDGAQAEKLSDVKDMYRFYTRNLIEYLEKNKSVLTKIIRHNQSEMVNRIVVSTAESAFRRFWKDKPIAENGVPLEISARFFLGGLSSVCMWWLRGGSEIPKEQLISYMLSFAGIRE